MIDRITQFQHSFCYLICQCFFLIQIVQTFHLGMQYHFQKFQKHRREICHVAGFVTDGKASLQFRLIFKERLIHAEAGDRLQCFREQAAENVRGQCPGTVIEGVGICDKEVENTASADHFNIFFLQKTDGRSKIAADSTFGIAAYIEDLGISIPDDGFLFTEILAVWRSVDKGGGNILIIDPADVRRVINCEVFFAQDPLITIDDSGIYRHTAAVGNSSGAFLIVKMLSFRGTDGFDLSDKK